MEAVVVGDGAGLADQDLSGAVGSDARGCGNFSCHGSNVPRHWRLCI